MERLGTMEGRDCGEVGTVERLGTMEDGDCGEGGD